MTNQYSLAQIHLKAENVAKNALDTQRRARLLSERAERLRMPLHVEMIAI